MGWKVYLVWTCLWGRWQDEDGEVQGSKIKRKDKILVPKFDSLIKHLGFKSSVMKLGVAIDTYHVNLVNAYVNNEKLYAFTRCDIVEQLYNPLLITN
jgi:hypothetical protein